MQKLVDEWITSKKVILSAQDQTIARKITKGC